MNLFRNDDSLWLAWLFCYLYFASFRYKDSRSSFLFNSSILASLLFSIYVMDNVVSFGVMNKVKKEIKQRKMDNTEWIRK